MLRNTEGVTAEDVREYEKTAIVRRSIDHVRARAQEDKEISSRAKSKGYSHIKSKVSQCIKVQNKVVK